MTLTLNKKDILTILNGLALVLILSLLIWSKPWNSNGSSSDTRTVTVSGEGSVEAVADEFTFSPSYDFKADTSEEATSLVASKAEEVTAGLKDLGLEDKDIKIDASTYENWYRDEDEGSFRSYFYFTVTVSDKDKAQEVQDYLLQTDARGSITPNPSFSKDKQKELKDQARSKAIADAKASAEKSADELNLKLGKVVTVEEAESPFYGGYPYAVGLAEDSIASSRSSLPVQTGEQEYSVNVKVVFEVK